MAKKKELTATELAKMGGTATLKKYGKKHFSDLVKKRWANEKKAKKVAKK